MSDNYNYSPPLYQLSYRGLVDDEQLEVLYEYLLAGIVEENYSHLDAIIW